MMGNFRPKRIFVWIPDENCFTSVDFQRKMVQRYTVKKCSLFEFPAEFIFTVRIY